MTKSDEMTLKKWLFVQWQKTHNPKFFLAGAVIGKVDNIFEFAEKNDIDRVNTEKFLDGVGICSALPLDDFTRDWMIHVLCDWANDKSFIAESYHVPSDIRALLNRVRSNAFVVHRCGLSDADRFYDRRLNLLTKSQIFEKRLAICAKEYGKRREKYLVSKSPDAKKFEHVLRALFERLDGMAFINPKNANDVAKFVDHEVKFFFADKIKNATTAQDIFSLWILMLSKIKNVNEILDSLIEQLADASDEWLRLHRDWWSKFFDFVSNWKKFREKEIARLETKAEIYGVDLNQMFEDALDAEFKIFAESA